MNAQVALHDEVAEDSHDREKGLAVARFGSYVLTTDEPLDRSAVDTVAEICEQLEKDPRVVSVTLPDIEESWSPSGMLYPSGSDPEGMLRGTDVKYWRRFSAPIHFSVQVPEKNQWQRSEGDKIPTHYEVYWDGMVVVVAWTLSADEEIGMSGGHVIEKILGKALTHAGYELYVQGCNPACEHRFAHIAIRMIPGHSDSSAITYVDTPSPFELDAVMPHAYTQMFPEHLFLDMAGVAGEFTLMKNLGQRVLDVETAARGSLDRLLALNNIRAEIPLLVVCQATFAVLMRRFRRGLSVLWLRQWMYRRMSRAWVAWSGWSVPASVKYRSARNCASMRFSQEA